MSAAKGVLSLQEEDLTKVIVASAHLGSQNLDFQMEQYIFKRRSDGVCLFNIGKMWDKLVLAARAIAAIENPADVCVISARQISQRGVLKYDRYTCNYDFSFFFYPYPHHKKEGDDLYKVSWPLKHFADV